MIEYEPCKIYETFMTDVVFVLNAVGPMVELCLNDVGMMLVHVLSKSCQNVLKKSSKCPHF